MLSKSPYIYMRLFLANLALIVALPAWGASLDVRIHREGDAILVSAAETVATDLHTAWDVLTDYARYSEFVPDLYASRVRVQGPGSLIVEQIGDARFLFMRQRVEVTLAVREVPFRSVSSIAIAGSFRAFAGRYEIAPAAAGTRFAYSARIVPADGAPVWLTALVLKSNIERQLGALLREMIRRDTPARLAQSYQPSSAN